MGTLACHRVGLYPKSGQVPEGRGCLATHTVSQWPDKPLTLEECLVFKEVKCKAEEGVGQGLEPGPSCTSPLSSSLCMKGAASVSVMFHQQGNRLPKMCSQEAAKQDSRAGLWPEAAL